MHGIAALELRREPARREGACRSTKKYTAQNHNRQFLSTCRLNAVKCHINVISIRKKCVYTQKMQIEAGVRGVVGDCQQMSAKKIKARNAPCLDFGLVGQLSVTSPLRLAGYTSSRRG